MHAKRQNKAGLAVGSASPDPIILQKNQRYSGNFWRKRWDSNPRYGLPHAGFQDRFLKPLGHSSI